MEEHYNKLASSSEVQSHIERIAREILIKHSVTPLFVALLRGAAPFTSKLLFEITKQSPNFHPELDYMTVSTYGDGRQVGEPHIVTDLAPSTNVSNRPVIVLDDVLDKGVTADFVFRHLQARNAGKLELAVLCDKTTERIRPITADYVGFTFKDNWLTGMGMDDASMATEAHRWLDEIWEVKQ